MDNKNQKLFIAQFIATICVVVIHCGTITNHPIVHFFLKSMVCRIAVPFFFVNNAYFFRINSKREGYSKIWLRRIVRLYTIVFLLYIPFGVQLLQDTVDIQWNLWSILLALVVSFLYTGSIYHLWYFPALISSLAIVKYMFQRFRYKWIFLVCFLFFSVGSLETYSLFISNPMVISVMEKYFNIFFTTRNGLFFSPLFISIGFVLADNVHNLEKHRKLFIYGLVAACFLGGVEGIITFYNQGIDKNFMYFTIPFIFSLYGLLVISKSKIKSFENLNSYSKNIFLFHMILIQIFNMRHGEITPINGLFRLMLGVFVPISIVLFYNKIVKQISIFYKIKM